MTNLIRAHFARLWRAPVFWLGTAASAAAGVLLWFPNAAGLAVLPPLCCAVVFSLFFGAEHADGTLRNKLAAGHSREAIYLSTLSAALAVMGFYLALSSPGILFTMRLYPIVRDTPGQRALAIITVALASAAVAAVMVCLCMLAHKRAVDPEGVSVTWSMPLCSLAEAGLVTALGMVLFKRKDIK